MNEVSGSTWVLQIMVLLILIFACFLSLVLNYSKTFAVKNELLTIVEKYEGVTANSLDVINNYFVKSGYKNRGKCPTDSDWYGVIDFEGNVEASRTGERYLFCFHEIKSVENVGNYEVSKVYYEVRLFYKFTLPVLGDLTTFRIKGRTNTFIGSDGRIGE